MRPLLSPSSWFQRGTLIAATGGPLRGFGQNLVSLGRCTEDGCQLLPRLFPEETRPPIARLALALEGSSRRSAGGPSWFTPLARSPLPASPQPGPCQSGRRSWRSKCRARVLTAQRTSSPRSQAQHFGPWFLELADMDLSCSDII